MVVDDNSATRRMVRNALQRNGHVVVEAPDGKTARALMRTERPRVVLQDLMLPDVDGYALVGELRGLARGEAVAILAFSGFVSELDEARVSAVGFDDIIPKPIAPSRLIPLIEAHLPARAPEAGQLGTGRRLVLADDEPMQLKLAVLQLGRLGFEIEAVPDGRAALDAIRRRPPDAIVSDVMMPELDGFGLAMAVRRDPALRGLPLVLVTSSYVEPADRELAKRAGASDLVPRTPELGELIEALRAAMASPGAPGAEVRPEALPELEREHGQRVLRQLERQVLLNSGLAKRCSVLASELIVLTGISEALLKRRDVDLALDEALAECFDAGGISFGAIYLLEDDGTVRPRPIGAGAAAEDLAGFFGHPELLREAVRSRHTIAVPGDNVNAQTERSLLARARGSAILLVPLSHLERTLGSLLMVTRERELERGDWRTFAYGVATQISHVLALARAYADREAAERRATDHAALLDAVFESAPDHVLQIDLEGKIVLANRPFLARAVDELVGASVFEVLGDPDGQLRGALDRLIETGEPQGFDTSRIAGGAQRWFSTRLGPIKPGRVAGAVLVARDITASKQTELHLMMADRMASVGTLAAGVAHEINNPLASVIANLDMAAQVVEAMAPAARPPELVEELGDARVAAGRVREIVRDLKVFSRAEEEHRGPVDVEDVLESTLRMAWNELRHRAKLVKRFGGVPDVEANEARLGQVFLNLIINAVHAIPPGSYDSNELRVSTSVDAAGRVVITIADTGAGIPPEVRPRLFTPFFTTKPVGVGTGLGLAISHRIVAQFGGTIAFDSEVGKGTAFHVALPAAVRPAPPRATARGTKAPPPPRRGAVLVIDDEEPLAHALRRFLSGDHEVTAVHGAREALELLRGGKRYDVILCDVMMPQVTGMELHAAVGELDPAQAARMVFLTGGAFTPPAREFLDRVPNRRIEKPFDLEDVRELVHELMR
jgi:PAS domain S-box-containing protein